MKLRTFLLLSCLSLGLFVGITLLSSRLSSPIPKQAAAGKLVWQRHNCVSCHTLFGNGGYVGEDLTNVVLKETPAYLISYLVDPPVMRPNKHTHHPGLDRNDAEKVIRYLEFVHAIPTLGWPPRQEKAGEDL